VSPRNHFTSTCGPPIEFRGTAGLTGVVVTRNTLPASSPSLSPDKRMETLVPYCVVAPQLRTKTTAWVFPLDEGYVPMMSLLHKPPVQPIRDALTRRADVQNETNLKASPERNAVPNGSRLSCGRNARRRKAVEPQRKRLASEATQFFPQERPAASSAC